MKAFEFSKFWKTAAVIAMLIAILVFVFWPEIVPAVVGGWNAALDQLGIKGDHGKLLIAFFFFILMAYLCERAACRSADEDWSRMNAESDWKKLVYPPDSRKK